MGDRNHGAHFTKDTNEHVQISRLNLNLRNYSRDKIDGLSRFTESTGQSSSDLFRNHNSFIEMKSTNQLDDGIPPKKRLMFVDNDPNLDPVDGIVSLLSAIYCQLLVVIGMLASDISFGLLVSLLLFVRAVLSDCRGNLPPNIDHLV